MGPSALKYGYTGLVLALAIYAFVTLRGEGGIPALANKRQEIRTLEKQNADLAREIEQKRERINRLRENQSEQELLLRDRLKLVRPKEKVFILEDEEKKKR